MVKGRGLHLKTITLSVRGRAPTVGGYERCNIDARLRLIESIINECVVAPNIHKRVLCNEDVQSADRHIKKG